VSIRLHQARERVIEGVRAVWLQAPSDGLVDQALREGLTYLTMQAQAHTNRFVVSEEALTDGTLLNVRMLLPDLYQLIALWRTDASFRALEYTTNNDGASVMFTVRDAPKVGDVLEATYRPVLTVEGFDGAVSTSLSETWQEAWVLAGVYYFLSGELIRLALGQGAQGQRLPGQGSSQQREALILAQRSAREAMEQMVSSLRTPVKPVIWNRGL